MEKIIYLAGGCFWGTQKYLDQIKGVVRTQVGFANGTTEAPSYEQVCHENTGHAETVCTVYDDAQISLAQLLQYYFQAINPTSINCQGEDKGSQYRTGIYYTDPADKTVIRQQLDELAKRYDKPIAVECLPLQNYYPAEEYHQKYLEKNPHGYCHLPGSLFEQAYEQSHKS